ncbi:MAG: hypothetical protein IJD88_06450 [Clostridia bacterium]|nr:hypothetical protein [Clostridia bacterium]
MENFSVLKIAKNLLAHLWMLILFAVIGFVGAYVFANATYTPYYTATSEMMVVSSEGAQINVGDITTFRRVIASYVKWLSTSDFYQSVADESGLELDPAVIGSMITYNTDEESEVFEVVVTASSVDTCKIISDSVETMIPRYLNGKYSRVAIHVLDGAGTPYVSANNSIGTALIGAVIGLIIAVVIVVIWEVFDVRIKSEEDLAKRYEYPILGTIPEFISSEAMASKTSMKKQPYAQAYAEAELKRKQQEVQQNGSKEDK